MNGNSGLYSDGSYYAVGESAQYGSASWYNYFQKSSGLRSWIGGSALFTIYPNGNCSCAGTFINGSDLSLKRDIELAPQGLAEVRKLEPKHYRRKPMTPKVKPADWPKDYVEDDRLELGFIAQDVLKALPDAIYEHDGKLALGTMPLIAALVGAVKELDAKLTRLEKA
jgi:hypothetical protein